MDRFASSPLKKNEKKIPHKNSVETPEKTVRIRYIYIKGTFTFFGGDSDCIIFRFFASSLRVYVKDGFSGKPLPPLHARGLAATTTFYHFSTFSILSDFPRKDQQNLPRG